MSLLVTLNTLDLHEFTSFILVFCSEAYLKPNQTSLMGFCDRVLNTHLSLFGRYRFRTDFKVHLWLLVVILPVTSIVFSV